MIWRLGLADGLNHLSPLIGRLEDICFQMTLLILFRCSAHIVIKYYICQPSFILRSLQIIIMSLIFVSQFLLRKPS
jgi:hypothetical protein